MKDEARQARLLAAFNRLSGASQELVLKVSEVIQETKRETGAESRRPAIRRSAGRKERSPSLGPESTLQ